MAKQIWDVVVEDNVKFSWDAEEVFISPKNNDLWWGTPILCVGQFASGRIVRWINYNTVLFHAKSHDPVELNINDYDFYYKEKFEIK